MIAALPMYDRREVAAANDGFWAAIRGALGGGPKRLSRDSDLWEIWQSPDLVFAQTCGYPYRARLHGHVTLIGTPDYGIKDCPAGYYNSVFIAHRDDPRRDLSEFSSASFAYNEPMSQSGWAAPMTHMARLGLTFATAIQSGGHLKSAQMVAQGQADIAAIDAVTWAMILRYDGFAQNLDVIAKTAPSPGLPYIAAKGVDKTGLFVALQTAISDIPSPIRDQLMIKGIVDIPAGKYLEIPTPKPPKR